MVVTDSNSEKWEIEDAARTLVKAEEIKAKKDFMKKVGVELQKQQTAIQKVTKSVKK